MSENMLTAIIADDSCEDRDILVMFAKDAGLNVLTTVASGEWLIDECTRYEPDIIIMNDHLNGTSGLLAYEKLLARGLKPYMIRAMATVNVPLNAIGEYKPYAGQA
ncbi:response regulator [Paenibacillus illinoisensis]|uniref:response regulator n=1 Tax=Paenibacillus illinoisensis TaxID=59845 RepID=UPI000DA2351A|nr:response regulator [Paenibacillus illinoisensis]